VQIAENLCCKGVFAHTPVHLVSGERSRHGWNVPGWALAAARSYIELPGVGHTMMFERPEAFGNALVDIIDGS
jgi:lipase